MKSENRVAEAIVANAIALGRELGISDRELARAALAAAIVFAEQNDDPDGVLALLLKGK